MSEAKDIIAGAAKEFQLAEVFIYVFFTLRQFNFDNNDIIRVWNTFFSDFF